MFAIQLLGQFSAVIFVLGKVLMMLFPPYLFQTDYFMLFMQIALFNN